MSTTTIEQTATIETEAAKAVEVEMVEVDGLPPVNVAVLKYSTSSPDYPEKIVTVWMAVPATVAQTS